MHPSTLGQVAQDHVHSLIAEADAARLARAARAARAESTRHGLRRRVGVRLISFGERLAAECPDNVVPIHGGRV